MKDIFNDDLIVGKEYFFYNDKNAFLRVCYGTYVKETSRGKATLLVTKRLYTVGNNNELQRDTFRSTSNKVSVKAIKLIPVPIEKSDLQKKMEMFIINKFNENEITK